MAAPIIHVVLTERVFKDFFSFRDKKIFLVGTCLPDIRYLKVIERNKTHFKNIKIHDLKFEDDFTAGLKFHSIVDQAREDFMVKNDAYGLFNKTKLSVLALKLLEERILYSKINDWPKYIKYFDAIQKEEIDLGLIPNKVKNWHQLLQQLFSHQPNRQSIQDFASNLFFTDEEIDELDRIATELGGHQRIIDIINNLYNDFDKILKDY
ncbi:MAG: hypothetical protein WCX71_02785 [Candidatus Buchananbacteria bacterium]